MLKLLLVVLVLGLGVAGWLGFAHWRALPRASTEVAELTPQKRVMLERLRAEKKFQPHDYPPLGYTGAESEEDRIKATAAVNNVIDNLLALPDGPIQARVVSRDIGRGMKKVGWLATEDRDRTGDYMIEVWYILGFRGATGRFAHGSWYKKPEGYGEPLPPGWSAPDKPRPIG
ncbi:MAG: DUF4844 domain-containing protein [Phenylobacterium sp.]|uniref:DUF4844 domain-containing protein n=1 Tax=Phenylobacterium sp. TaxID=1871053 RepID=UPI0025DABB6B|nr:DUF4844 domain-containing protein [Phenylobacterium sp.]MBI1196586.1 DUF4844 domain-containing protein [Phenylobacterium sp.]